MRPIVVMANTKALSKASALLAMAARDAIALAGGPSYAVDLGRLDELRSSKSSVDGKLSAPFFNLDQLNKVFAVNGLSQADMIALSAVTRWGWHTAVTSPAGCGDRRRRTRRWTAATQGSWRRSAPWVWTRGWPWPWTPSRRWPSTAPSTSATCRPARACWSPTRQVQEPAAGSWSTRRKE
ncbi:hypothetical protein BS78_01G178500 [Paspalum vaginatum]|nr:hypothetical protein BS78_01G178500 [Paspalum vaginatum]